MTDKTKSTVTEPADSAGLATEPMIEPVARDPRDPGDSRDPGPLDPNTANNPNNPNNPSNPSTTNTAILALDHVTYSYMKGGKKVINDLIHDFRPGKLIAITGPSGAGKTTVLSLLSGLTLPTEGRVMYDGRNLAELNRYRFRTMTSA